MLEAVTATRRFGVGARPGELTAVADDPKGWVLAQLSAATRGEEAGLPGSREIVHTLVHIYARQPELGISETASLMLDYTRQVFDAERRWRLGAALSTSTPLIERLVWFWSNHFTVSVEKSTDVRATAGSLEREAVRPHLFGRFRDMLQAVARHPAMLNYLDNLVSVGPNSPYGLRNGRGLNENYGRELLELHTLGVQGGYGQQDVIEVAKALTGWRYVNARAATSGAFVVADSWHEPGSVVVLGKTYPQEGEAQGAALLDDLASHPATARFLAWKLARHFVADPPPPELVQAVEEAYRESDGDLAVVVRTLCTHPLSWSLPARKVLPPWDYLVAVHRALDLPAVDGADAMLGLMGQPTWMPQSPAGWPEEDEAWASPLALLLRMGWVEELAGAWPDIDAAARARDVLGGALRAETAQALCALDRPQALALFLASPEFQRR